MIDSTLSGIAIRVAHTMVVQESDLLIDQSYKDEVRGIISG